MEPLTGLYRPAAHGQFIVFLHGTGANRTSLLPEARLMARHGFGVLLLDLPGHGGSGGRVKWDEPELLALRHAVDWLYAQPGAPPSSVGVYGFSMGSLIALRGTLADQRIMATVLAGAFTSTGAMFDRQAGHFGALSSLARRCGAIFAGDKIWRDQTLDLVGRLGGRPILLISGSSDVATPPDMADALYRSAAEPKFIWLSLGAGHGEYYAARPASFENEVVSFFEAYLPNARTILREP